MSDGSFGHSLLIGALLALVAAGCGGDVEWGGVEWDWEGRDAEARKVRSAIAPAVAGSVEVDVGQRADGRRIDITVTGAPADNIGLGSVSFPDSVEQELKARAKAIARSLHSSYEHADRIGQVEISFMKEGELGPIGVSTGRKFSFEGGELEKL